MSVVITGRMGEGYAFID